MKILITIFIFLLLPNLVFSDQESLDKHKFEETLNNTLQDKQANIIGTNTDKTAISMMKLVSLA